MHIVSQIERGERGSEIGKHDVPKCNANSI